MWKVNYPQMKHWWRLMRQQASNRSTSCSVWWVGLHFVKVSNPAHHCTVISTLFTMWRHRLFYPVKVYSTKYLERRSPHAQANVKEELHWGTTRAVVMKPTLIQFTNTDSSTTQSTQLCQFGPEDAVCWFHPRLWNLLDESTGTWLFMMMTVKRWQFVSFYKSACCLFPTLHNVTLDIRCVLGPEPQMFLNLHLNTFQAKTQPQIKVSASCGFCIHHQPNLPPVYSASLS